ncbi:MAG: hypothetical protein SynsKO_11590 [Synoicihabitans sp.]
MASENELFAYRLLQLAEKSTGTFEHSRIHGRRTTVQTHAGLPMLNVALTQRLTGGDEAAIAF